MMLNRNARERRLAHLPQPRKDVLPPFRGKALARGSPVITLVVTCLGFFMVLLDASIVNVTLPTIQGDLHAHLSDLQWVVDAYTLPFAALLLTAGMLGDRYGRQMKGVVDDFSRGADRLHRRSVRPGGRVLPR